MRNYLTFNGTDLRDFGVYITGSGTFNAPEREYSEIAIPGRNGSLIGNEKRLANIEVTYPAFIYSDFKRQLGALRAFLLSQIGFHKLQDSYHPDEYRLALFRGPIDVEPVAKLNAGQFDLVFNCRPQRFLTSGDTVTTLTASGTIVNPTSFDAQPHLRVYGTGSVTFGGTTITITSADGYTDIDCALMEAYKGAVSKNDCIELSDNDFPVIPAGENTVTLSGVTSVEITPRWWTL